VAQSATEKRRNCALRDVLVRGFSVVLCITNAGKHRAMRIISGGAGDRGQSRSGGCVWRARILPLSYPAVGGSTAMDENAVQTWFRHGWVDPAQFSRLQAEGLVRRRHPHPALRADLSRKRARCTECRSALVFSRWVFHLGCATSVISVRKLTCSPAGQAAAMPQDFAQSGMLRRKCGAPCPVGLGRSVGAPRLPTGRSAKRPCWRRRS
jgi:hypothetical protein